MQRAKEQGLLAGNMRESGANLGRLGLGRESGESAANLGRLRLVGESGTNQRRLGSQPREVMTQLFLGQGF